MKKALLDPKSQVHKMTLEQIRKSDPRYQQYPNFAKYCTDLKLKVKEEKKQVEMDDIAVRMHKMSFPRSPLNKRGYPHWDTHPARGLLEADIANNLHKKMKPLQLMATREAYKEFPPDVFAKRYFREISKQKAASFWADKRNKKGMKRYLENNAAHGANS